MKAGSADRRFCGPRYLAVCITLSLSSSLVKSGEREERHNFKLGRSIMRIILRVLAIYIGLNVPFTVRFVWRAWHMDGYRTLIATGAFGWITIFGWIITVIVGSFAGVQLWRLREIGRVTSLIVFGFAALYYAAGPLLLREPITPALWLRIGFNVLLVAALSLPSARRICSKQPTPNDLPQS